MLKPIRCFTCGSLVGDKYDIFTEHVKAGNDPGDVLDSLGVKRYCCRRMILANVDIIDQALPYYEFLAQRHAEFETDSI
jgi:DNA-directed RNA polymerase subunit N